MPEIYVPDIATGDTVTTVHRGTGKVTGFFMMEDALAGGEIRQCVGLVVSFPDGGVCGVSYSEVTDHEPADSEPNYARGIELRVIEVKGLPVRA